jgi:hypothetical protein
MVAVPGLTTFLAFPIRRLTRAISAYNSPRQKLVVSRDLGVETMSLLYAREDLEVQTSLTRLIKATDKSYETSDRSVAGGQEM